MDNMSFLNELNPQQKQVCIDERNILLKACREVERQGR